MGKILKKRKVHLKQTYKMENFTPFLQNTFLVNVKKHSVVDCFVFTHIITTDNRYLKNRLVN